MGEFSRKGRKELVVGATGKYAEDWLAMAEVSPDAADGVHRMLTKLDGLVPLSTVMQGVLAKVDALRRAA